MTTSDKRTEPDPGTKGDGRWFLRRARRVLPFLQWFHNYSPSDMRADFVAGLTVALVLIPQSMAYAQLADLPAYYGLYAAFLPPMIAAMFGSSHQLATGPVAIVSLMTATALSSLATAGSEGFIAYAILLSFLVGLFQFLLGALRLGMVVNFLSHPVVNGFTNAAALIIATSQLPKLFGIEVDKAEHHYLTVYRTLEMALHKTHLPTLGLGLMAFLIMWGLKRINPKIPNVLIAVVVSTLISWSVGLENNLHIPLAAVRGPETVQLLEDYDANRAGLDEAMAARIDARREQKATIKAHGSSSLAAIEARAAAARLDVEVEELTALGGTLRARLRGLDLVVVRGPGGELSAYPSGAVAPAGEPLTGRWHLKVRNGPFGDGDLTLMGGGPVVGAIPSGLPRLAPPAFDFGVMRDLFPMAIIISLLGFMEAISIAKAMANRTGQRLDPNQELIGQGIANMVGSFASSYPVSGSFSRSAVNIQAGAVTGLSSVFSSLVVVATLLFFTPLMYHLPQSVLAAIIMMAVGGLVNVKGFVHAWHAQRYDGIISAISFVSTLYFAPHLDKGIMVGVALSLGLYLLRNMRPATTVLALGPDGHYHSAERLALPTCDRVSVIRFNESLIFANVNHLENMILKETAKHPALRHVLLVGNGINELDASGEVMLAFLLNKLRSSGIDLSLSGLNDRVRGVLRRTKLDEAIGETNFHRNVNEAVEAIHHRVCPGTPIADCPLLRHDAAGVRPDTET